MMIDRGLSVDHPTIYRWVQAYSKTIVKNFNKRKGSVSKSSRLDETYIKVNGDWKYLYRADDKQGRTIDFFLSSRRDLYAASSVLCKAIRNNGIPKIINIDQSGTNARIIMPQTSLANPLVSSDLSFKKDNKNIHIQPSYLFLRNYSG
jgi:putative transposase